LKNNNVESTSKRPFSEWIHLLFCKGHTPKRVLFRVDAGAVLGLSFGHLSRCLIIAQKLKNKYGTETLFLMRDYAEGVKHAKKMKQNVNCLPLGINQEQEKQRVLLILSQFKADLFIIDLPYEDMDFSYLSNLRESGIRILFIDDCRFINPDVDVILNSNILAKQKTKTTARRNTQYFLGPEYFIFDDFQIDKKPYKKQGHANVLITFGGSDPTGLTLKVLQTLAKKSWANIYFVVILGPGYLNQSKVKTIVRNSSFYLQMFERPKNLIPFLQGCDLAICAGGRTMYELYYIGKEFFPIASSEHEVKAIKEFISSGIINVGMTDWVPNLFIKRFREMINKWNEQT